MGNRGYRILGAVVLTAALALSSCDTADPLSGYRGTNLIAGSSFAFSAGSWASESGSTYMGFESTTYDPPTTGADVYRLELKNLIPYGDFEDATAGSLPDGWSSLGTTTPPTCEVVAGSTVYGTNSLHYKSGDTDQYATFDLRGHALDLAPAGARYMFRFSFRAYPNVIYSFDMDGVDVQTWSISPSGSAQFASVDTAPAESSANPVVEIKDGASVCCFVIGSLTSQSNSVQECYIDDLQMVRMDLDHHLVLSLAYDAASLPLVSGVYRFSVYVKADPSVGTVHNRFTAASVVLGISRTLAYADGTSVPNVVEEVLDVGADWSRVSVTLANHDVNPDAATITMGLYVVPADDTLTTSLASGSVLISSPTLEMLPDGS